MNVAARLEQAAQPGEVLIGEPTRRARPRCGRGRAGRAARAEGQGRAGSRLPARCASARRRSGGTGRCSSAVSASSRLLREAWERARAERALRAGHGRRRRRRRQVAARGGAARLDRARGRARPLPPVRGGDHVLAGRRGAEAARRAATGGGRRRGDPLAARRERGRSTSAEEIAWAFRKTLEQAAVSGRSSSSSTTSSGARRRSST